VADSSDVAGFKDGRLLGNAGGTEEIHLTLEAAAASGARDSAATKGPPPAEPDTLER
jgi:hypothetical protein